MNNEKAIIGCALIVGFTGALRAQNDAGKGNDSGDSHGTHETGSIAHKKQTMDTNNQSQSVSQPQETGTAVEKKNSRQSKNEKPDNDSERKETR